MNYSYATLLANSMKIIHNTLDAKITRQLPELVETEIKRRLPDLMRKKFNEYVKEQLPAHILKEISNQMPYYIANNGKLIKLFEHHKQALKTELEIKTRQILDEICSKAEYQRVTMAHLEAIDSLGREKINEIMDQAQRDRSIRQREFESELDRNRRKIDHEISRMSTYEDRLIDLEQILMDQEKQIFNFKLFLGITVGVLVGHIIYAFCK